MLLITVKLTVIFFTRAVEHMDVLNLIGKLLKNEKNTAVSNHLLQCICTIDFDHFDILATVSKFTLLVKASLLLNMTTQS